MSHICHSALVCVVLQSGKLLPYPTTCSFLNTIKMHFREKSFVKLTCKFRPKKIGLYSENVILTIKRRNNLKTTITLTGRCILGNVNVVLHHSNENEVEKQ